MRDYNKIADRVFRRRDEYLAEKKRKRALYIKSASVALSCCIMIMLGIGIWKTDLLSRIAPKDDDFRIPEAATTTTIAATTVETVAETTSALTTAYADTTTTAADTSKESGTSAATAASSAAASTVSTAHTTARSDTPGTSAPSRTTTSDTKTTSPSRTTMPYEHESQEPTAPGSRATTSSTRKTTATTIRTTTKTTSATTRPVVTTSKQLSTLPAVQSTTSATKEAVRTTAAITTEFLTSGSTVPVTSLSPVATLPSVSTSAGTGDMPVSPVNPTVPAAFTHLDTYYELTGETADFNRVSELIDCFYADADTGETIYVYLFVYDGYSPDELCAVHIDSTNDYYLCTPSEYPTDTPKPSPKRPLKAYDASSGHLTMPDKKQTFQTTKTQPPKLTQ